MILLSVCVRQALAADIPVMQRIRFSVTENRLDDPTRITEESYLPFLAAGSIWVAETNAGVTGFAIVNAATHNVWAIFVDPSAEGMGHGRALHDRLLQWSGEQGLQWLWLSTMPGTRAEQFYRKLGWTEAGSTDNGEIRFERRVRSTRTP